MINFAIAEILQKYFSENPEVKIVLLYDKSTYKVNFKLFEKTYPGIKRFDFGNSEQYTGIQYADWVAGDAGDKFRNKKFAN